MIAVLLVAALLIGSMPMAASAVLGGETAPVYTLDICHPLPVFAVSAASCALAASSAYSYSVAIEDYGAPEISNFAVVDRDSEAPDPPPPKPLA